MLFLDFTHCSCYIPICNASERLRRGVAFLNQPQTIFQRLCLKLQHNIFHPQCHQRRIWQNALHELS